MEWRFEGPGGMVTVSQEGGSALCRASRMKSDDSIYKAWLLGEQGRALLGTLIPEGECLRLRRTIPVAQLERQGAWPPLRSEIVRMGEDRPPPAPWRWEHHPGARLGDPLLARCLEGVERALICEEGDGLRLALPLLPDQPFPLPPLFCLGRVERLEDAFWVAFSFDREGHPRLFKK